MRRVIFFLPLMMLGLVANQIPASAPPLPHILVAFDCAACERRIVNQSASLEECHKAAYTMNDGADEFISIHPRHNRKFECRPVR